MTSPTPPHSVTFSAFLRPSSDIFPLPNDYTDLPTHIVTCVSASSTHVFTRDRLLEDSPRVSSFLPDRVCVHRRMVTYSGHFLLRYSHGTFFCNVLNARRRLRPLKCVCSTPAWLQLPDISIFAIATHSFSHICTLSNTHFCSCLHCHYYKFLFLISENNAVLQVSRLVIPGNAGYPG